MADIINLHRARKALTRKASAKQAEENRVRHGRTKTERSIAKAEREKLQANIDAHHLGTESKVKLFDPSGDQ